MKDRQFLFFPHHVEPESDTFQIEYGKQMTIAAIGLEGDDHIEFQMVHVPSVDPDHCACPPGVATLPTVSGYITLTCCGEPIRLTPENPVVVLDSPQRMLLRAVLNADDTQAIYAWALETDTRNVTDRMRGCPCEANP